MAAVSLARDAPSISAWTVFFGSWTASAECFHRRSRAWQGARLDLRLEREKLHESTSTVVADRSRAAWEVLRETIAGEFFFDLDRRLELTLVRLGCALPFASERRRTRVDFLDIADEIVIARCASALRRAADGRRANPSCALLLLRSCRSDRATRSLSFFRLEPMLLPTSAQAAGRASWRSGLDA